MSETKEKCPECGHLVNNHGREGALRYTVAGLSCAAPTCLCTRTYESFVGEKDAWHPFEGGTGYETPCTRCGVSFSNHHGIGTPPDHLIFHDAKPEPSLQLLVIDFSDVCVVKVEQGEWKRDGSCKYRGSVTVTTLPLDRLRDELDGEKRSVRIEQNGKTALSGQNLYQVCYGYGEALDISQTEYDALSELAGKKLPIYEPTGKWEMLVGEGGEVHADTGLSIWRYTR